MPQKETGIRSPWLVLSRKHLVLLIAFGSVMVYPCLIQRGVLSLIGNRSETPVPGEQLEETRTSLERQVQTVDRKLLLKIPRSYYLVINSSANEFTLYKGTQMISRDKCSTGSYILLKNGEEQQWMFKTPTGEFRVRGKTTAPVWKKPDWAFVEEGLQVPSPNHPSRFEYGVLGDYALNLGDGYLIHGTLYQRFLGLPVTHGCIRLSDENLELIYQSLTIGSRVYIF